MTGKVSNLNYEEYAAHPGVNASLLEIIDRKSMKAAREYMAGTSKEESDTLDFGKAFHALLLENKREFVEQPDTYPTDKGDEKPWNWNASFCKQWSDSQDGKTILTAKEIESLCEMVDVVRGNEELQPYLQGECELSVFSERKHVPLKIRIDLLPVSGPVIDFKKARSAEPETFVRQSWDLSRHLRAAFYLDVLAMAGDERREYWLVAVEDKPPYDCSIIKLKDVPLSFIAAGRRRYRNAFVKFMEAQKTGFWPSYGSSDAEDFAKPWMIQEMELAS